MFSRITQMFLFWRLFGLEGLIKWVDDCDQFYGVTSNAWPGVTTPAAALATFGQTGLGMLNAIKAKH